MTLWVTEVVLVLRGGGFTAGASQDNFATNAEAGATPPILKTAHSTKWASSSTVNLSLLRPVLKAEYTSELAQDLKAVHGLDAEVELANILSTEILAEINREVVRTIYNNAKLGCQQQGLRFKASDGPFQSGPAVLVRSKALVASTILKTTLMVVGLLRSSVV